MIIIITSTVEERFGTGAKRARGVQARMMMSCRSPKSAAAPAAVRTLAPEQRFHSVFRKGTHLIRTFEISRFIYS